MMRFLYLTKAVIRNFRSIEYLYLDNIGDITILIGPNESGKSNILQALKWFSDDTPLSGDDVPVDKEIDKKDVIVELYFKIHDLNYFKNLLKSKINDELRDKLGKHFAISLDGLELKKNLTLEELKNEKEAILLFPFLKLQKYADGSFAGVILDNYLRDLNTEVIRYVQDEVLKSINLPAIFKECFEETLENIFLSNNIPENQIQNGIKQVKNNSYFSSNLNSITEILSSLTLNDIRGLLSELDSKLQPVINGIQVATVSFSIAGRSVGLSPRGVFTQAYYRMKSRISDIGKMDFKEILQNALKNLKPNFVYLAEEMELKGTVKKTGSWSNTLREDGEYAINYRLFNVLGIDLEEFDKMNIARQRLVLENKLDEFSNKLIELWKQQKIRIVSNVSSEEINFYIKEVDENNNPIKTTFPEARSRGFKWYLAYLITLKYLKNKEREYNFTTG